MANDRILLVENMATSYNKQYLLEFDGGDKEMKRLMESPDIPIYMNGLIQMGDTPNRNKRKYSFASLKKECERYLNEDVKELQSYGELDHPESSAVPELKNAAMTIEDIWFKGKEVHGRIKILNAFMPQIAPGLIARGIILNGKKLGISSRAFGSVFQDGSGYDVVDDDLDLICWDLVSRPSTVGANLGVAKEKIQEGKILLESINLDRNQKSKYLKEVKKRGLSSEQKLFLDIMGVEKFLQLTQK